MKTIRTVLLTVILLGSIMPAMAQVNFTEKTEFVSSKSIINEEATQMYLITDDNGITLSSVGNILYVNAKQSGENFWRICDRSCAANNKSYNTNFFQIVSANT